MRIENIAFNFFKSSLLGKSKIISKFKTVWNLEFWSLEFIPTLSRILDRIGIWNLVLVVWNFSILAKLKLSEGGFEKVINWLTPAFLLTGN